MLRDLAEADLGFILEDQYGFRWPIAVTNPDGLRVPGLFGFSNDIAQVIDPETGTAVSGRSASVAIRTGLLADNNLGIPRGISDSSKKPWVVEFDDINGGAHKFKVSESMPDRSIGVVVCMLEAYE